MLEINRVKFIEGEPYCRFDGILMTPEAMMELYGYDGEFDIINEDTIIVDGTIYTNKNLGEILKLLGEVHYEIEKYDPILSQDRGFVMYCAEEKLNNSVVIPLYIVTNLKWIKPFKDYKTDYPNLNIEKYKDFINCLDEYYKHGKVV